MSHMQYEHSIGSAPGGELARETDTQSVDADRSVVTEYEEDERLHSARRRRIIITAVVVVAVLIALAFFLSRDDAPAVGDEEIAAGAEVPAVSVLVPGRSNVAGEITTSGTLSARRPVPVGSVGEGGEVRSVRVDQGDWVRQGQILAVIDRSVQSRQVEAQRAQVEVARSDARLAQANLDRASQLVERGFISKADIDQLTATRDAAAARVRVAEAQLGELNARNARLNIVAPASGLILTRSVEPGQVVGGGTELFTIASGGEMEMAAQISESDLARLSVGVPARVTPVGTEQAFAGQVWQLAPTIDETTRQGTARIALPYDRALRPGGFASAVIQAGTSSAPVLPESALLSDQDGSYVFVLGDNNRVRRKAVRTGIVTPRGIAVIEGLSGNERVVLRAGGFLSDGDEIEPRLVKREAAR
nr:efflux RND transporter periplasmic adaptor subunit [Croceicoccus sp. YJ47]